MIDGGHIFRGIGALLLAATCSGCAKWGHTPECGDPQVQQAFIDQFRNAVVERADAQGKKEPLVAYLDEHPPQLLNAAEKARSQEGALDCSALLSVPTAGKNADQSDVAYTVAPVQVEGRPQIAIQDLDPMAREFVDVVVEVLEHASKS